MSAAPWKQRLLSSLAKNRRLPNAKYIQLATVKLDGRPNVRTVVFRCAACWCSMAAGPEAYTPCFYVGMGGSMLHVHSRALLGKGPYGQHSRLHRRCPTSPSGGQSWAAACGDTASHQPRARLCLRAGVVSTAGAS